MLRPRWFLIALALCAPAVALADAADRDGRLTLREGWQLQSSASVRAAGDQLSTPAFKPGDWHQVTVPTTVVAALVKNKVLRDPYFGMNMRELPGGNYKVASNFSNADMPADSPFRVPWWYRNSFTVPASFNRAGGTIWLRFQALNYRANVWLNGQQIGQATELAGAVAQLRAERHQGDQARRHQRAGGAGVPPAEGRPGHHLRRLEPHPARQEHGPVARGAPGVPAARWRSATRR